MIDQLLGEGKTALVYRGVHTEMNAEVAIKIINKERNEVQMKYVRQEIEIMCKLHHENISHLYDVIEDDENIYLIMEYLPNGTIQDELETHGIFSEQKARQMLIQTINGLLYLHSMHIVHRDIKAQNIMQDAEKNIRLMDFGLSTEAEIAKTACGSPAYAPPEMILRKEYTDKVDIWSLGVLLYFVTSGKYPFKDVNMTRLINKIVETEPEYPECFSPQLADLLKKMLTKDPISRISLEQILKHPWVTAGGLPHIKFPRPNDKISTTHSDSVIRRHFIEVGNECDLINLRQKSKTKQLEYLKGNDLAKIPKCKSIRAYTNQSRNMMICPNRFPMNASLKRLLLIGNNNIQK